jgi:hypothetical protein
MSRKRRMIKASFEALEKMSRKRRMIKVLKKIVICVLLLLFLLPI